MRESLIILYSIIAVSLFSCKDNSTEGQLIVLNDVFLSVTDTLAYRELSLRPPNMDKTREVLYRESQKKNLIIIVPDTLFAINTIISGLMPYCMGTFFDEREHFNKIKTNFCNDIRYPKPSVPFNLKQLKKTGKYTLASKNQLIGQKVPIVGQVKFTHVIFDETKTLAVFVASISDGEKTLIEKLFLAEKNEGVWKIIEVLNMAVS